MNVFIFDYRGYGKSEGRPHEKGLYRDTRAAYDYLIKMRGVSAENIVVYGKSIPTSEVGGDLIDLYHTKSKTICYITDVSGHGVAAGLLMGMFQSAIHTA